MPAGVGYSSNNPRRRERKKILDRFDSKKDSLRYSDTMYPYSILIDGVHNPSEPYDPFLLVELFGIRAWWEEPPSQTTYVTLKHLYYSSQIYRGTGADVERIINALAMVAQYDKQREVNNRYNSRK